MLSKQVVWSVFSSLAVVASAFVAVHGETPGAQADPTLDASASLVLAGAREAPVPVVGAPVPGGVAALPTPVSAPLLGGHPVGNGTHDGNGSAGENASLPLLSPRYQLVVGPAGTHMEYRLQLENPAGVPRNLSIGLSGPSTWQLAISPSHVTVAPGDNVTLIGHVRTLSSLVGERDTLTVTAWDAFGAASARVDICARALLQDPCAGRNSTHRWTNETQPPKNDTRPPTHGTQPPGNDTRPPTNGTQPPGNDTRPPTNETQPPGNETQPPGNETQPPTNRSLPPLSPLRPTHYPPSNDTSPPKNETQPPSNGTQPPSNDTSPRSDASARVGAELIVGGRRAQNDAYVGPKDDGEAHPEV